MKLQYLLAICLLFVQTATWAQRTREKLDADWKFALGHAADPARDFNYSIETVFAKSGGAANTAIDPRFNDSLWQTLDLPHDWAVGLPFVFDPAQNVMMHGYKPLGGNYPATSVGWYRKHLYVDARHKGQRHKLVLDGVYRDAQCWINGFYLGRNESGYVGIAYDITDFLRYNQDNVIVIRADATQYEGWFYEGAGIYRHVWLERFAQEHIAHDGIFAHAELNNGEAVLTVETEVDNETATAGQYTVAVQLLHRNGQPVISNTSGKMPTLTVAPMQRGKLVQTLRVKNPRLWQLDDPYLYRIKVTVLKGKQPIDEQVLRFGIRSIAVNTDGLLLNGKKIKLQGVNCHQDHAGVGAALPDYLQYYRVRLLKNMGVNAYRTSHNAPTPELLDACDSLGMLVMDEQRQLNSGAESMNQFERLVRRDRSRTCVFMWSIGNEEWWMQTTDIGKEVAQTFARKLVALDPSRTHTFAADLANVFQGVTEVIPVRGFNYREYAVADYHRDHPHQPIIGTEMGSTVTTRGQYALDSIRGYLPDHDMTAPWWASTAEKWWTLAAENDFWLGGFVWTGFDYRGEPTPFAWPNINSHFGILDMCGFPKNNYYYYQSWWSDKDVLHISPHWNWLEHRGDTIDVWVNSNAETVELLLNDASLGTKSMPRNGHLQWQVPYQPGTLKAVATRQGRTWHTQVATTGQPTEVVVTPYRTTLTADGHDATVLNISVLDAQGREVPNAANLMTFHIVGEGKIIGVGNGDPSSHEPDQCADGLWQRSLFNGHCQVIVQATTKSGTFKFEAKSPNLWTGSTDIITVAPEEIAKVSIDSKYQLSGEAAKPRAVDEMIGADISFLPELEAKGRTFKQDGVQADAIELLQRNGFNYVRLRVFHRPAREGGYSPGEGFCDLEHTVAMAKRVKAAGMKLLLDFHYSDYWADPGKQYKPQAWEGLAFEDLKKALYDYTREVMLALEKANALPDMVQVGNEINHGIVWPEGSVAHPNQLAQLLCAGTAAVKSVNPRTQMMLHVALGGQNDETVWFVEQMLQRGVHFDVLGLSYYPKWHGTVDDLYHNMEDLERRFEKDLIVVEYSAKKDEVHRLAFGVPNGRGKGTCIWEPLNTWEAIFDWEGNANAYLRQYNAYKQQYLEGE